MIEARKQDHMEICLNKDVVSGKDFWSMVKLFHRAAPETDMDDISTGCRLLGKDISAPIVISAITGGYSGAETINQRLAAAAEKLGVPMGVGSQRPALEDKKHRKSYEVVARYDPPLVFGNIGAPQLIPQKGKNSMDIDKCKEALEMINGDYLAVHFNYLQEVIQPEGDDRGANIMAALGELARHIPVIAKETGAGISSEIALEFQEAGVRAIDIGGMGGTSFSAVEYHRTKVKSQKNLAELLWDWGIPTPVSIIECRRTIRLPLIATGGVRNGLHAAKALAMGAEAVGIAGGILPYVTRSEKDTVSYLENVIRELKTVMFLMGCNSIDDLRCQRVVVTGELRDWMED